MDIRITRPLQGGAVRAIASKSEAHRLLICAALSDKETFIDCADRSEDIDATARCLEALGAKADYGRGGFTVTPMARTKSEQPLALDCGESGTLLRFLLPVCGALGAAARFHMGGRLPARPMDALRREMEKHGCTLSAPGVSPLDCAGQLTSGAYTLPGDVSSQFVSGLLLALPLLPGDSRIAVSGVLESRPYVDITLDVLRRFGVTVTEDADGFSVPGGQAYRSPEWAAAGGDWSNAAFWLAAGALGKNPVICTGLDIFSRQGDKAVADLLARFGAKVAGSASTMTITPGQLWGIDIDAGDVPDLIPALAAVAAAAQGTTRVRHAERLRLKESDRLAAVAAALSALGADIQETPDGLVIRGKAILTGGTADAAGDHRIAMMCAILSAVCENPVTIRGAEAVDKSYPAFFDDFTRVLGGAAEEV